MPAPSAWHLAAKVRHFCPKCRKPMARKGQAVQGKHRIPTINHILPKCRGGTDWIHGGAVRNWELMCSHCNEFLAACGHCIGVVAAIEAVAGSKRQDRHTLAVLWRIPQMATLADEAFTRVSGGIDWAMRRQRQRFTAAERPFGVEHEP